MRYSRQAELSDRKRKFCIPLLIAIVLALTLGSLQAFADPVTWGSTVVVESSQTSQSGTWMRLLHLQDGSWLSATSMYGMGSNIYISIKRSTNDLRSWSQLTTISESGRDMDNPVLAQLPNGNVLMANRSTVGTTSHRLEVWTSTNIFATTPFTMNSQFIDDIENPNSTTCPIDFNVSGHGTCGVWEPNLVVLPSGDVAALYADESYQPQNYDQVVSERISTDGGQTWGTKSIVAGVADGVSRAGMPYITLMQNGEYMMTFEVGDANGNYPGYFKTSTDCQNWTQSGVGWALPSSFSNPIVQSLSNGMLVMSSGSYVSYWSGDYGSNWNSLNSAFTSSNSPWSWQSIYQTRTNEIAQVANAVIRLGTMAPMPYHDTFAAGNSNEYSAYGGTWSMSGGVMTDTAGGGGDKLVMVGNTSGGISGYGMQFRDYTVQADVSLAAAGDAGILIRASSPAVGADSVYAYYVGVGSTGVVFMGDEHDGYSSLSGAQASIPGGAPANTWIHLTVTAANCAITVTAQQAGSTSQGSFTYTDGNCAHMGGTIGLRTDAVKASWRNVTINETGASPASNTPYLAPFASGSTSGWTTYGGSWSLSSGVYNDSTAGLGDKSIVSASSAANLIVQSDVEFGSVSSQPNSGVLLGVSGPATGTDSLYGFYAGTGVQSLLLGYESYGWTALTATPYENALTAGQWLHLTVETRGCIFTVAAQPLSQQYGYIQTYIYPNCTATGAQGVRQYDASTGFENFSVLSN